MRDYLYRLITDQIDGTSARVLKIFLWVLSVFYGIGVGSRNFFYQKKIKKQYRLPKPVVSVGNITWGGVGKTPLVEYLAKVFKSKGLQPVILTRGYMAKKSKQALNQSDEATMLKERLPDVPILVGKNRFENAKNFLKEKDADIFILDDGFQHLNLYRDVDIVAIDSTNPFGNEFLIPRGILREPVSDLKRTDIFVLTKTNFIDERQKNILEKDLKNIFPETLIVQAEHRGIDLLDLRTKEIKGLEFLAQKNICCFSGIGNPRSFEQSLIHLKAHIQKSFIFPDHEIYCKKDLEEISQYCLKRNVSIVITTFKDAVKIKQMLDCFDQKISVFALRLEITIESGKDLFLERIFSLIQH
ncbi:MAG TPA: tetraacyldisaccharide 4'-kinase [Candidatus Omnitrophota bacterium]|nr:tetraacyldisaccharide 4'-kinase [Candidatus Omnitrophota bacterium]